MPSFPRVEASMGFAEYSNYDGLGLAELVKKKEIKPAELVEAALERIERHNPQLNAVVFKGNGEHGPRRSFRRRTDASQGHPRIQEGLAEPGRLSLRAGRTFAFRFNVGSPLSDGWSHSAGPNQCAGIRRPAGARAEALRPGTQSVEPRSFDWRLLRRIGCRRGSRHCAARARQ